jgi:hypothetical protein
MLCGIIFIDEKGMQFIEHINVAEINRLAFRDPRNIDAGTYIYMRNNDILYTPETMDIIAPRIQETWREAAAVLMADIYFRMAQEEQREIELRKKKPRTRKP